MKTLTIKERWESLPLEKQEQIKSWHKTLELIKQNSFLYKNAGASPVQMIEDIEFILQMLWGFPIDANFHSHWIDIAGCKCPRLDNMERIGYGRVINEACYWHAEFGDTDGRAC